MRLSDSFMHLAALAALSLAFSGCSKSEENEHEHGGGGNIVVPDHYAPAVEKCQELSAEIAELIAAGHLDDVHAAAEGIVKIAEKIPQLAMQDLPAAMLRDANIKARELAGMFSEIDEAADAGKKAETIAIHNKMKALIAGLAKHSDMAKKDE